MSAHELLAENEATGDQEVVLEAKALYKQGPAESPDDADLQMNPDYVLEIPARNQLRQAETPYERVSALTRTEIKARFQVIGSCTYAIAR